jgi:hypothetical protein
MVHLDGVAEINGTAHYNKFCQSFLMKTDFNLFYRVLIVRNTPVQGTSFNLSTCGLEIE